MTKPVVHYRPYSPQQIMTGFPALVYPVDHPSNLVSNTRIARTSKVIRVGENGEFETLNTVYQLVKETK